MKLKTTEIDGKQYAEIADGQPIYVTDSGDQPFDVPGMHQKITSLNGESMGRRKALEDAEAKLKIFEGLDPEAARKAIETVQNLDDKKLIDAGEIETVKANLIKTYEEKLRQANDTVDSIRNELNQERLGNRFANSKFIAEKLAIPNDIAQSSFGRHFEFKDGRIVAKDKNGNPIYSKSNPGDVAGFEEAISIIVDQYDHRDSILKGNGHEGAGSSATDGSAGKRKLTRSQFELLNPVQRAEFAKEMGTGKAVITE